VVAAFLIVVAVVAVVVQVGLYPEVLAVQAAVAQEALTTPPLKLLLARLTPEVAEVVQVQTPV
jgi:hypothetical protein